MKSLALIGIILSLTPLNDTDDTVTTVIAALDSAVDNSVPGWQARVETKARPGDLKIREWTPVNLGHSSRENQLRYKGKVVIPKIYAGTKISGGRAELHLRMSGPADFSAEVFVNGAKRQDYPVVDPVTKVHNYPEILLTESAQSGTVYEIEILVKNRMMYPPHEFLDASKSVSFNSAILRLEAAAELEKSLSELKINLQSGEKLAQEWTPDRTHDTRPFVPERKSRTKIDSRQRDAFSAALQEKVALFEIAALEKGDSEKVKASLTELNNELQSISAYAKQFTIYLAGNAHIDLAWLWRTRESVKIAANTFRSVMNNLKVHPELVYAQSQAQAYDWVENNEPELFEQIVAAAKNGSWDVVGGMWAEPDCNLIGGESWVRQILYAQRYFSSRFGKEVTLGWNPDSFGYNWNMPQFYSKAGIKAFITQKISWNHQTRFPYHLFWWSAPDGSRILTYFPTGGYTEKVEPERMVDQLLNYEHATGMKETLTLIGFGNHGGGPNLPMLERAQMFNSLSLFPNVKFIRPNDFINNLLQKDLSDIPVWNSEMYLENHRGTFTTQSNTKMYNRRLESLFETAEKAASLAYLAGDEYPAEDLENAWKIVLLNQFHDILPGSSITPVYRDAEETYAKAQRMANRVLHRSLQAIAGHKGPESDNWKSLLVFNPLSWTRTDKVVFNLSDEAPRNLSVTDQNGKRIDSTIVLSEDGLDRELVFYAQNVAALGTSKYYLNPAGDHAQTQVKQDSFTLENQHLRVSVNPETGNISSIVDKKLNRELLQAGKEGNVIELHENLPSYWDAWNIGYTDNAWTIDAADSVEYIEENAVRSIIRVKKSFLGFSKANRAPTEGFPSSFFVQDIVLGRNSQHIDIKMSIDWWEDHTLLKVSFPFAIETKEATYEIPYASITRSTERETAWEKARYEVPVHRWADLSQQDYGVSLINNSKYGMDIHKNNMRLTLLTSALWPDPMADRGKHIVEYSVYPHEGDWKNANTVRTAIEMNLPLVAHEISSLERADHMHAVKEHSAHGNFDAIKTGNFRVDAENAIISTLKKTESRDTIIVRVVETKGQESKITVDLPEKIAGAYIVDLLEKRLGKVKINNNKLAFIIKPFEIKSFELEVDKILGKMVKNDSKD